MAGLPWVIVQHHRDDGPGMLAEELTAPACASTVARVDLGEALPAPANVRAGWW